jgi:hypothetical protein
LEGFDRIFGGESPHNQCQLTVGGRPDGSVVDPLHIFRGAATTVHLHNKLGISHGFSPLLFYAEKLILLVALRMSLGLGD